MKGQKGFTLIELMIVVAVIGVLSAIALPAYQNYVKKSEAAAGLSTLRSLQTNIDNFIASNSGAFPEDSNLGDLGAAKKMNKLGEIALDNKAQTVTFEFNTEASIPTTETLVMTKDTTTGLWGCESKVTDVDLKGCPKATTPSKPNPKP
ncbi:pilin [Photobacterium sp. J15]|uniref:pilin n=1 Tax=Photobacterium sp. J15 TaxID=265901 RepID=UPI0007E3DE99|nr:pilin [Photobacterium sp. J15]